MGWVGRCVVSLVVRLVVEKGKDGEGSWVDQLADEIRSGS